MAVHKWMHSQIASPAQTQVATTISLSTHKHCCPRTHTWAVPQPHHYSALTHTQYWLIYAQSSRKKTQLFYRLCPYFSPLPSCSTGTSSISISLAAVFNMPAESINWWTHNKEFVCKPAKHQICEFVELKNRVSLCSPITFPCQQRFCVQAETTINQTSTQS